MFRIVTLEREFGSGGGGIAAELARRLGWRLWDQQLTCEIAKRAEVTEYCVTSASTGGSTVWRKLSGAAVMSVVCRSLILAPSIPTA